jgi:hypothetical protein
VKRAIAAVIIIGATFLGYRTWDTSYRTQRVYHQFAEELFKRHYDVAAAMADGLSASDLQKQGTQEKIGPEMFQTLFPSRFEITSRERNADGDVVFHAIQTVLFNPPGVESAVRPAMYARMNQVVTLRKGSDGWKVAAFENKFDTMDAVPKP